MLLKLVTFHKTRFKDLSVSRPDCEDRAAFLHRFHLYPSLNTVAGSTDSSPVLIR